MNAVSFDTLKFARRLQADGAFTEAQSERLVEALGQMLSDDLASKQDVGEITHDLGDVRRDVRESTTQLESRIREAELRLEAKLAEAKAEIIKWFFGVVGIQTAAIIGSVLALVRAGPHG